FAAGSTSSTQNASVLIVDDRLVEASELFALTFTNLVDPSGQVTTSSAHTLTAIDNESATVTVVAGTTTVAEGSGTPQNVSATLSITSVGTGPEELAVAISANLPGNADYTASPATFPVGSQAGERCIIHLSAL